MVLAFRRWLYRTLLERVLPVVAEALSFVTPPPPPNTAGMMEWQALSFTQFWQTVSVPMYNKRSEEEKLNRISFLITGAGNVLSQLITLTDDQKEVDKILQNVAASIDIFRAVHLNKAINDFGAGRPDDNGLLAALNTFSAAYSNWASKEEMKNADTTPAAAVQQALEMQDIETNTDRLEFGFPLREVADARERLDALIKHLGAHESYYRFAIFQGLPIADQMFYIAQQGLRIELLEPRVLGMVHSNSDLLIAIPLNAAINHEVSKILETYLTNNEPLTTYETTRTLSLPTPGITMESRLGACSACEEFIEETRRLELERKKKEVELSEQRLEQEKLETLRYRKRLEANPPTLDDPDLHQHAGNPIRLELTKPVQ
jgi:hypothetical protein